MEAYTPIPRKKMGLAGLHQILPFAFSIQQECDDLSHEALLESSKSHLKDAPGGCVWADVTSLLGHFTLSGMQLRSSGSRWDTCVWLHWSLSAARCSAGSSYPSSYRRRPLWRSAVGAAADPYYRHPPVLPICHSASPIFWCDGCNSVPPYSWSLEPPGWDDLPPIKQKWFSHN